MTHMMGHELGNEEVQNIVDSWENESAKRGANYMLDKYGIPQEATYVRLIWHDARPWKRIMVINEAIPHDFPDSHTDDLYQVIPYNVVPEKASELLEFDQSVIVDPLKQELGSRCEIEGANFITTNLCNEIINNRMNIQEAKEFFREAKLEGKNQDWMEKLMFEPDYSLERQAA